MTARRAPLTNSVLAVNSVVETRFIVQDGGLNRPYRARLFLCREPRALPKADILRPLGAGTVALLYALLDTQFVQLHHL